MANRTEKLKIQFEVDGDNRVKVTFNDVAKGAENAGHAIDLAGESAGRFAGLTDKLTNAAKIGGAVIGSVLAAGMTLYVRNTIEAERVGAQLEARLKDLGPLAAANKEQIGGLAEQLMALSTFDDEGITEAATALLAFTNIKPELFGRALETALDVATAKSIDLAAASEALGKALNNPLRAGRALRDLGIELTDQQNDLIKAFIKTGDIAGAQTIVLDELSQRYGTAAEAARDTLGGALKALTIAFDNVLEGDSGNAGVRGTRAAIESLIVTLNDPSVKDGVESIVNGLVRITNAAIQTASQLGNAGSAIAEFFSKNEDKSLQALMNKRTQVETELFGKERAVRDGWGSMFGGGTLRTVDAAKQELADLDRLIKRQTDAKAAAARAADDSSRRFDPRYEQAALNFNPNGRRTPVLTDDEKKTKASTAASKENREAKEAQRRAEAGLADDIAKTNRLIDEQVDQYERQRDEVLRGREATEALIQQYEFELSVVGLRNKEYERAIALRQADANATDDQRQRLAELSDALFDSRERQQGMDSIIDGAKEVASAVLSGTEDIGNAIDNMRRRAADFLADKAIEMLFSWIGGRMGGGGPTFATADTGFKFQSGGGGGAGGWLSTLGSLFGGIFGGGRATGGDVRAGQMVRVNEVRPEVYEFGDDAYLMAGGRHGRVVPNPQITAASGGGDGGPTSVFAVFGEDQLEAAFERYIKSSKGERTLVTTFKKAGG